MKDKEIIKKAMSLMGKRSLVTMTKQQRIERSKKATAARKLKKICNPQK